MTRILLACLALIVLVGCGGDIDSFGGPTPTQSPTAVTPLAMPTTAASVADQLLVLVDSTSSHVTLVDPATGAIEGRVEVGPSPWRIAVGGSLGYVTTATGLAIVDVRSGAFIARLPYQASVGPPTTGEYREGGMGLALSPDGQRVFVGVYTAAGSFLEVFHTRTGYERSVPIGNRPFDVIADPSRPMVYVVDHDSYTLTAVDIGSWEARTIDAAPLGRGAFDKPHYGLIVGGEILLPFQGRTMLARSLESGATREIPLSANTHQHGLALAPDGKSVAIVGSGAAGEATAGPSLTIVTLADGSERIIPLKRPHELVAFSLDGAEAYLTGGYLLDGGWEGITVVDLASGSTREIATPARPLGIYVLGRG